jgi:uncharacterized protein (DUF2267 family)
VGAAGLDVYDKAPQTTHPWLDELIAVIGPDRQVAWHVLCAILRAVRDRVPQELAVHLGSQLPLPVRRIYYDQWHAPRPMDEKPRAFDAFLAIEEQLTRIRPINHPNAAQAAVRILSRHPNPGQVEKVQVERAITQGDGVAAGGTLLRTVRNSACRVRGKWEPSALPQ